MKLPIILKSAAVLGFAFLALPLVFEDVTPPAQDTIAAAAQAGERAEALPLITASSEADISAAAAKAQAKNPLKTYAARVGNFWASAAQKAADFAAAAPRRAEGLFAIVRVPRPDNGEESPSSAATYFNGGETLFASAAGDDFESYYHGPASGSTSRSAGMGVRQSPSATRVRGLYETSITDADMRDSRRTYRRVDRQLDRHLSEAPQTNVFWATRRHAQNSAQAAQDRPAGQTLAYSLNNTYFGGESLYSGIASPGLSAGFGSRARGGALGAFGANSELAAGDEDIDFGGDFAAAARGVRGRVAAAAAQPSGQYAPGSAAQYTPGQQGDYNSAPGTRAPQQPAAQPGQEPADGQDPGQDPGPQPPPDGEPAPEPLQFDINDWPGTRRAQGIFDRQDRRARRQARNGEPPADEDNPQPRRPRGPRGDDRDSRRPDGQERPEDTPQEEQLSPRWGAPLLEAGDYRDLPQVPAEIAEGKKVLVVMGTDERGDIVTLARHTGTTRVLSSSGIEPYTFSQDRDSRRAVRAGTGEAYATISPRRYENLRSEPGVIVLSVNPGDNCANCIRIEPGQPEYVFGQQVVVQDIVNNVTARQEEIARQVEEKKTWVGNAFRNIFGRNRD